MLKINTSMLTDRLGAGPEIKDSGNGRKLASFTIAHDTSWQDENKKSQQPEKGDANNG